MARSGQMDWEQLTGSADGEFVAVPYAPPLAPGESVDVVRTQLDTQALDRMGVNVMIASAASFAPSHSNCDDNALIPTTILSIGRYCPITPVEETSTCSFGRPSASAVRPARLDHRHPPLLPLGSWRPGGPGHPDPGILASPVQHRRVL